MTTVTPKQLGKNANWLPGAATDNFDVIDTETGNYVTQGIQWAGLRMLVQDATATEYPAGLEIHDQGCVFADGGCSCSAE